MKKCACGREYRAAGSIAFRLTPKGLKGCRVCPTCAKSGALIVGVVGAAAPRAQEVKSEEELDVRRVLRGLARRFKGMAKIPDTQRVVETWEAAADIAEAWAKEPATRVLS